MTAVKKAAVMETSLPDLLAVNPVDVVGKCLDKKTTRLLRIRVKWIAQFKKFAKL